jgi:tripartite ATP-independent transporter DctP family solute receptor
MRKSWKQAGALLLSAAMLLTAAGCSNSAGESKSGGDGQVYKFVFAHCEANDASTHDAVADAIKEYLEEHAPGRFEVEIYTDGQLGSDRENIESVQEGTITMTGQSTPVQVNFVPSLAIFDAPFAYRTLDDCEALLANQDLMGLVNAEFEKAGLKQGLWVVGGYRHLTTNKEIKEISDLKGMKIRTMENKYHMALWECLGVTATPLASSEIFTALQQGTVDGQENDYGVIVMKDIVSVQKYLTETHHLVAFNSYILNLDWYNSLPEDLKKVFDEALAYAKEVGDDYTYENQAAYRQQIQDKGVTINAFTEDQIAEMKDTCASVYDMIRDAEGMDPAIYEAFTKALDEIYAK